jgi:RNA polymerase sigma-70 factor, ECF subfamily
MRGRAPTTLVGPIEGGPPSEEERARLDALYAAAYDELRRLAVAVRRSHPAATLNPTALVHEAWVKLARSPGVARTSRMHFKRIAGRAMRQVLVEAARRRAARRRGGRGVAFVTFDESLPEPTGGGDEVLALDSALEELAAMSPRQAMMVEGRFFGGLNVRETAELLEVSEATVLRDWRAARAWLTLQLRRAG